MSLIARNIDAEIDDGPLNYYRNLDDKALLSRGRCLTQTA